MNRYLYIVTVLSFTCILGKVNALRAAVPPGNSWQETRLNKQGSISILWNNIEPFIYQKNGKIIGVEYELMEGFKAFLQEKYAIQLTINWIETDSFEEIYPAIKHSKNKGLFAVSYYSITEARKKEVKFSPPYMPDLNVLVTNNRLPVFENEKIFFESVPQLNGYSMKSTTMETDLMNIRQKSNFPFPVQYGKDDYEVMEKISQDENAFGYAPLSIYVVALQKGIKIKRQQILNTHRPGFAAIYGLESDWDEPVNAYFNSQGCKILVEKLIHKYLGQEVADIILEVSSFENREQLKPSDLELLTKEREIVTQRLIDTALDAARSKNQRDYFILIVGAALVIAGILYSRFKTKSRLNKILQQRNKIIASQNSEMENLNGKLKMKMLQAKMNPHFLFNSLNAIQYHIGEGKEKEALQYISKFSIFLRKLLQSSDQLQISLSGEIELAELYLWLELNRFPKQFSFDLQVKGTALDSETPPMLIHSILQDVLYAHILTAPNRTNLYLHVEFVGSDKMLQIEITDNGEPADAGIPPGLDFDAIEFLYERIDKINQASAGPITIDRNRASGINRTVLHIPQPLFQELN